MRRAEIAIVQKCADIVMERDANAKSSSGIMPILRQTTAISPSNQDASYLTPPGSIWLLFRLSINAIK